MDGNLRAIKILTSFLQQRLTEHPESANSDVTKYGERHNKNIKNNVVNKKKIVKISCFPILQ